MTVPIWCVKRGAAPGATAAAKIAATPYAQENVALRRVLALRGETGGRKLQRLFRPPPRFVQSTTMDNLLWLERLEVQAAIVIQRLFRKRLKRRLWGHILREKKGAQALQRLWRKFWVRQVEKKKSMLKNMMALKLQAAYKGRQERFRFMSE